MFSYRAISVLKVATVSWRWLVYVTRPVLKLIAPMRLLVFLMVSPTFSVTVMRSPSQIGRTKSISTPA